MAPRALAALNASWCNVSAQQQRERVPISYDRSIAGTPYRWRDQLAFMYPRLLAAGLALPDETHDVYQFGVFAGQSLVPMRDVFRHARLYGFDTFEGMPASSDAFQLKEWGEASFNVDAHTVMPRLKRLLRGGRGSAMIKGLYTDTLMPTLAATQGMRPAAYVDVDCDLY